MQFSLIYKISTAHNIIIAQDIGYNKIKRLIISGL